MDDEESASFYREGFVLSKNYYDIVLAILRFMGYDGINEEVLPPVLVPQTMIETTELCFRWIVTQAMREAIEKKLPGMCPSPCMNAEKPPNRSDVDGTSTQVVISSSTRMNIAVPERESSFARSAANGW